LAKRVIMSSLGQPVYVNLNPNRLANLVKTQNPNTTRL